MSSHVIEANYPFAFRKEDAQKLAAALNNRRSVVLTGMKRVGISNFLRFFLYHEGVSKKYLNGEDNLIIPVDLNDLVEREIYPFWILTFKRLSDAVKESDLLPKIKKQIDLYFVDSIQSQDLFLTLDYFRKSIVTLCNAGYSPTIFFIRFDRMKNAITPEFFSNFQGLIDATQKRLSYVFTSDRPLTYLEPNVFTKQSMFVFSDNIYIKPAKKEDVKIILESSLKEYDLKFPAEFTNKILELVDGHTQYLLFALISIKEAEKKIKINELSDFLINDERISLQSEELWESLTSTEQTILINTISRRKLSEEEVKNANYLISSGFIDEKKLKIFNPIFDYFVKQKSEERKKENSPDFSKKENSLLKFLEENKNEVCEREQLIEAVWPETESLGVTDWAIDRLVARVRSKLKDHNKNYEIVTIKTRGYKLIDR